MASDLSSECTETIGVLDEKEEGEISLEDVSSSEEGHLNYGYGTRVSNCSNCLSTQHNAAWCTAANKFYPSKCSNRREVHLIPQDAVQGKENLHQINESGCTGTKHTTSTLQEKNDDLVPISSDSDMEIVGLADNSKQIILHTSSKSKVKKKRKKKRNHPAALSVDDLVSSSTVDTSMKECVNTVKHDIIKSTVKSYHREGSPVHRNRTRVTPRSPTRRHKSIVRARSPFRRSKSPIIRARSPTIRRSPRRLKSPKRSPYRSSTKSLPRKSQLELTSSHNYVDTHKLLKKVRELDSIGTHSLEETLNKNKEHASSLKEKLTNMMKGVSDNNSDVTNSLKEKSGTRVNKEESNDIDEEEDLALLRQKALETKQNKSNKQNDQPKTGKNVSANINDDQDEEDLELRMIALRSAVLKKHQNRVEKGIRSGKYKKSGTSRSESPFTQSFLDSIPIPGEELLNFASPPHTPLPISENNHTEDMDLDTDVEREKEKLPYSPTDKITANIPIDTELLGIQPSDVSFISLVEANSSPNFSTFITPIKNDQKSYQGKIIENQSYLPSMYYSSSENSLCPTNINVQCLGTNTTEISKSNLMKTHNSHGNVYHYDSSIPKDNNNTSQFADVNSSQEMPYSPTDTPIYDPDLLHTLPQICGPLTTSNSSLVSLESYTSSTHANTVQYNHLPASQYTVMTKEMSNTCEGSQLSRTETLSLHTGAGCATTPPMEPVSPCSSMITIDDLPELDPAASLSTDSVRNIKSLGYMPSSLNKSCEKKGVSEPLYMKGVPDVTKDTNKIPTLINRTLVPAPILKTNKQLQLPLPTKKCTPQQEPTFKSAEMLPVIINDKTNTKMNASFKPIKIMSFPQKSHCVLVIPTAFHDFSRKDASNEESTDNAHTSLVESNHNVTPVQNSTTQTSSNTTGIIKSPIQKKKKLLKKGLKRKSTSTPSLIANNNDTSGANSDNISKDKEKQESNKIVETAEKHNADEIKETNAKNSAHSTVSEGGKNEISLKQNELELGTNCTTLNNTSEQVTSIESRRQSLDEDEEALRAILLASLPKRAKTSNNFVKSDVVTPVSVTTTETTVSTVSTTIKAPNQVVVNQTASRAMPTTANVTEITNTTGTTNITDTTTSSSPHINDNVTKNDKNQHDTVDKINVAQNDSPVEQVKPLSSITSEKKRAVPITKGPQKKLVKRISIPASTKVVNNAKRYQNTMIQKKLNLQKATLYNKQKIAENKIISKVQSYDMKRSTNTKPLPDTQRIVINLESDTESDSESERQKNTTVSSANSAAAEKYLSTVNSTADFEKNLDQFLRAVRKKQETMAAARPTSLSQTPKKDTVLVSKTDKSNSPSLHTPLAVRHLPASQQEEYRRLKQQILEREKLKLHRTIENNSLIKNKNSDLSLKTVVPSSPSKELHVKVNQIIPAKSQSISTQQVNKENFSKNVVDSLKDTSVSVTNFQLSLNKKTHSTEKQESSTVNQAKTISRSIVNLNIPVSSENNTNLSKDKVIGTDTHSTNTLRKVFEIPIQDVQMKTQILSGLKVLSTDEVNRKYVKVQVKNDTNERVVIVNDKVTLNDKTSINNENVSRSTDGSDKSICDCNINQIIECVEKDIITSHIPFGNNNVVDSDASTIILSQENQNIERDESFDTSVSTIRLSQYQENSRVLLDSSVEDTDDSHFLLFKNNSSSSSTRSIEENWETIKKDVKAELNTLINLPRVEQEQQLLDTEQKLVMKRYIILDDLAEMSSNLRQWHMERDLQTNLAAEVKKLREQLKVAEERLQVQRNRINGIGPKVVVAHGKINAGRKECFKLATICSTLGNRVVGKEYKVPEAGAQILDNRLKEVANHTRLLSRKKVPSINISETHDFSKLGEETVTSVCTEISQTESLLLENSSDTTVSRESEPPTRSCEIEKATQVEISSDNVKNMVINNSSSKEDNTEQEVCTSQTTNSSDTPVATTAAMESRLSKDSQDLDNKNTSEKSIVKPIVLESSNQKQNFTRSKEDFQTKRTLFPYESILTHFKVQRNTNPNGILCPYALMGTCSDGECQFVHQTENQAK